MYKFSDSWLFGFPLEKKKTKNLPWVSIHSGPPAHGVGRHDGQHLGGLDAHHVVGVPQQSPQALQAACGAERPLNGYQSPGSASPEANRRARIGNSGQQRHHGP